MKTRIQSPNSKRPLRPSIIASCAMLVLLGGSQVAQAGFSLGDAGNFVILFEGAGSKTLHFSNSTITGNIGIGGTGKFSGAGPATLNGTIYFSAADTGQFSTSGSILYN